MDSNFKNKLPKPEEIEKLKKELNSAQKSPEEVLDELKTQIQSMYNERILVLNISSGEVIDDVNKILTYSVYLLFTRHKDYSYKMFEAKCTDGNSNYPLEIYANSKTWEPMGRVNNETEFRTIIDKILELEKTRNVIISMY